MFLFKEKPEELTADSFIVIENNGTTKKQNKNSFFSRFSRKKKEYEMPTIVVVPTKKD